MSEDFDKIYNIESVYEANTFRSRGTLCQPVTANDLEDIDWSYVCTDPILLKYSLLYDSRYKSFIQLCRDDKSKNRNFRLKADKILHYHSDDPNIKTLLSHIKEEYKESEAPLDLIPNAPGEPNLRTLTGYTCCNSGCLAAVKPKDARRLVVKRCKSPRNGSNGVVQPCLFQEGFLGQSNQVIEIPEGFKFAENVPKKNKPIVENSTPPSAEPEMPDVAFVDYVANNHFVESWGRLGSRLVGETDTIPDRKCMLEAFQNYSLMVSCSIQTLDTRSYVFVKFHTKYRGFHGLQYATVKAYAQNAIDVILPILSEHNEHLLSRSVVEYAREIRKQVMACQNDSFENITQEEYSSGDLRKLKTRFQENPDSLKLGNLLMKTIFWLSSSKCNTTTLSDDQNFLHTNFNIDFADDLGMDHEVSDIPDLNLSENFNNLSIDISDFHIIQTENSTGTANQTYSEEDNLFLDLVLLKFGFNTSSPVNYKKRGYTFAGIQYIIKLCFVSDLLMFHGSPSVNQSAAAKNKISQFIDSFYSDKESNYSFVSMLGQKNYLTSLRNNSNIVPIEVTTEGKVYSNNTMVCNPSMLKNWLQRLAVEADELLLILLNSFPINDVKVEVKNIREEFANCDRNYNSFEKVDSAAFLAYMKVRIEKKELDLQTWLSAEKKYTIILMCYIYLSNSPCRGTDLENLIFSNQSNALRSCWISADDIMLIVLPQNKSAQFQGNQIMKFLQSDIAQHYKIYASFIRKMSHSLNPDNFLCAVQNKFFNFNGKKVTNAAKYIGQKVNELNENKIQYNYNLRNLRRILCSIFGSLNNSITFEDYLKYVSNIARIIAESSGHSTRTESRYYVSSISTPSGISSQNHISSFELWNKYIKKIWSSDDGCVSVPNNNIPSSPVIQNHSSDDYSDGSDVVELSPQFDSEATLLFSDDRRSPKKIAKKPTSKKQDRLAKIQAQFAALQEELRHAEEGDSDGDSDLEIIG